MPSIDRTNPVMTAQMIQEWHDMQVTQLQMRRPTVAEDFNREFYMSSTDPRFFIGSSGEQDLRKADRLFVKQFIQTGVPENLALLKVGNDYNLIGRTIDGCRVIFRMTPTALLVYKKRVRHIKKLIDDFATSQRKAVIYVDHAFDVDGQTKKVLYMPLSREVIDDTALVTQATIRETNMPTTDDGTIRPGNIGIVQGMSLHTDWRI